MARRRLRCQRPPPRQGKAALSIAAGDGGGGGCSALLCSAPLRASLLRGYLCAAGRGEDGGARRAGRGAGAGVGGGRRWWRRRRRSPGTGSPRRRAHTGAGRAGQDRAGQLRSLLRLLPPGSAARAPRRTALRRGGQEAPPRPRPGTAPAASGHAPGHAPAPPATPRRAIGTRYGESFGYRRSQPRGLQRVPLRQRSSMGLYRRTPGQGSDSAAFCWPNAENNWKRGKNWSRLTAYKQDVKGVPCI